MLPSLQFPTDLVTFTEEILNVQYLCNNFNICAINDGVLSRKDLKPNLSLNEVFLSYVV